MTCLPSDVAATDSGSAPRAAVELLGLRAEAEMVGERADRAPRGPAVAVGVDCVGHRRVRGDVGQQGADGGDDAVLVGADEPDGARVHRLGTLSAVAHDEYGLAE